jgi:hypothetical protein
LAIVAISLFPEMLPENAKVRKAPAAGLRVDTLIDIHSMLYIMIAIGAKGGGYGSENRQALHHGP